MEEDRSLGKYRILKTLGEGGEGRVYLTRDESLSRLVAVKRLWSEAEKDTGKKEEREKEGERLRQEAAFLRDMRHPMLPVVYELFYQEGWYLVMEYIRGISLHKYIKIHGPVGEEQGRLWAAALLDVLSYLHTRETPVIYSDLKPDNIIVCRDGSLRLVDFGAAGFHRFGEDVDGRMAYTAGFAAPEQRGINQKEARADERSDIYAFGKTLSYMVTGVDPQTAACATLAPSCCNPLLSAELDRVIRRCVEEAPDARYQVVSEIMRDLQKRGRHRTTGKGRFIRRVEKQVCLTGSFRI